MLKYLSWKIDTLPGYKNWKWCIYFPIGNLHYRESVNLYCVRPDLKCPSSHTNLQKKLCRGFKTCVGVVNRPIQSLIVTPISFIAGIITCIKWYKNVTTGLIKGHVGWIRNGDEWGLNFIHSSEWEWMGMNNILVLSIHPHSSPFIHIHPHSSTFVGIRQKVSTKLKTWNVAN